MIIRHIRFSFSIMFLLLSFASFSQLSTSSPYSRYGLGVLSSNTLSEQSAMGGQLVSFSNASIINPSNPATYSAFQSKTFLFSTGLSHHTMQMNTQDLQQITNNTHLSHITLGFPINSKISMSTGFLPYSDIGYMLHDNEIIPEIGGVTYNYSGDGGISKYYVGGSINLYKNLSVGVNAAYLFGGLNRTKDVVFNDETIFNVNSVHRTNLKGYYYQIGLIYEQHVHPDYHLTFGFSANNNSSINAKRSILSRTYELNSSYIVFKDTFENDIQRGSLILPKEISSGISIEYLNKLLFVMNYSNQDWSEYRLFDEVDSLQNSMRLSVGVEYVPVRNSVDRYWNRVHYRIGTSYYESYLQLRNHQIKEMSFSVGLGMPVKRSNTHYNIAIEIGERGTTEKNLIKERFLRLNFGVTFGGKWFVQRKYD